MPNHLNRKHQYTNNFLTDVIFRIDFGKIELSSEAVEEIKQNFSDIFPVHQKIESKSITFQIKEGTSVTEENENILNNLVDKDTLSEKILEFDQTHFAFIDKKYYSYSSFEEIALRIIKLFDEMFKDLRITRVGLRYINQIELSEREPYKLEGIINDKLTAMISFNPQEKPIIRAMNSTEYKIDDDTKLTIRSGLFNKNYPSEPINKEFILDFDCYSNVIDDFDDVKEFIGNSNKTLAIYFEDSIGERLREEALHEEASE